MRHRNRFVLRKETASLDHSQNGSTLKQAGSILMGISCIWFSKEQIGVLNLMYGQGNLIF